MSPSNTSQNIELHSSSIILYIASTEYVCIKYVCSYPMLFPIHTAVGMSETVR